MMLKRIVVIVAIGAALVACSPNSNGSESPIIPGASPSDQLLSPSDQLLSPSDELMSPSDELASPSGS